ncbi:MAG: 50S ribosomal protein L10 [Planctomycetota bacterium]|nr:MAG: 50S ribosomal protein L10 [Planctomycetota bacterium]
MPSRINELIVQEYAELLQGRDGVVLLEVGTLTVQEAQQLRNRVRENGARFQVTKSRLARVALAQTRVPIPPDAFAGTCAVLVGDTEATIKAAKAIEELWKKAPQKKVRYRAAWFDGSLMTAQEAARIAFLPDKQTVRAMLCGALLGPARKLAMVLNEVPASSARALRARAEQGPSA